MKTSICELKKLRLMAENSLSKTSELKKLLAQIEATIQPLSWSLAGFNLLVILVGVVSVLIYFFFSMEHKGAVGKVSRLGIAFLMISFGASFGYTIMARLSLLIGRISFLMDDWLNVL